MDENARLILGLRALGLDDTAIVSFLLWIATGEEQYKRRWDPGKYDFTPCHVPIEMK